MWLKGLLKNSCYFIFPPLKRYHTFEASLSNKVSFWQWGEFWLRGNRNVYWPVHKNTEITHPDRIFVGINSNAGTRPGCYLQGNGGIRIGNYVHFASNIGIISANHSILNQMEHANKEVRIDDYCWIGMNVVILPGVHLGPRTVVGAGSIVTKSFPDGYCVIAGNPAKLIKEIKREQFVPTKYDEEFFGYIHRSRFKEYAKKHLQANKYYSLMINE